MPGLPAAAAPAPAGPDADPNRAQREQFEKAWDAARRGDRKSSEVLRAGLANYVLYPYLEYDEFLSQRKSADPQRMATFLQQHADWAFTNGLERAWLRTMGQQRRWDVLLQYGEGHSDTEVRCYLGQAKLSRGLTDGLVREAQSLWLAGRSQPDACDPLFDWMIAEGGATDALAWQRIKLALEARNPYLIRYLSRFLDEDSKPWADLWFQQDSQKYTRLDRAEKWSDGEHSRDITDYGLRRLARSDAERAWRFFGRLDGHFAWGEIERATILREIALWSAVEGSSGTFERMRAVPAEFRDGTLLEWWARAGLLKADWAEVVQAIDQMPDDLRDDDRWQFWSARAALANGQRAAARSVMSRLASRATYYGFLAADFLGQAYAICAESPRVETSALHMLKRQPDFIRSRELELADLENWARAEWRLAVARLEPADLPVAAALALEMGWTDAAILVLADSPESDWYEWRFPVAFEDAVKRHASASNVDQSWVFGVMRSESAMAEHARSPADARGLMQITPPTARQITRRYGISYQGTDQLMQADFNIQLGTTYLRELLDRYGNNAALASGAYNAGPRAVDRWLSELGARESAIWIETVPYFETREYIPRVLAFSAIYDWRRAQPVTRVSSRMPDIGSTQLAGPDTTDVFCPQAGSAGSP